MDDPAWDRCDWLAELRNVPRDARWPRLMTGPHPLAVGSYGAEFAEWAADHEGRPLRWWQVLVATRLLEHDAEGRLVWLVLLLSTSRQVGKSWLLRLLAMFRLHQAEWFGEEQLVMHTGKDLPVCREVQRPARTFAKRTPGYAARETNGQEEVITPDGSRWVVRGRDSVYGYPVSFGMVDEAWGVSAAVVDEGLEPTMAEREQPQMVITSTAHRRTTSLYPSRRATALDDLATPDDVLLIEWSAAPGSNADDPASWRAASPHWNPRRERMVRSKLARALKGESDPEDLDDDPLEAFRSQWLNDWSIERQARLIGRDEPLMGAETWGSALDLNAAPFPGSAVTIAVEDWYGKGASVAVASRLPDGRVHVWGECAPRRSQAGARATQLALQYPGSRIVLPAPLRAAEDFPKPPAVAVVVDGTAADVRAGLPLLRELLSEGELSHDGGDDLTSQVLGALVLPAASGLAISPRSPRTDLLRAMTWAALDVTRQNVPTEAPAIY